MHSQRLPNAGAPTVTSIPVSRGALDASTLPEARELSSFELLRGEREILIRHGGQLYRLRHTRNDKLILTK